MRCVHLFATLAVVVFAGCPSRNSDPAPDAADSAAGHDAGGSGGLGGSAPEAGNGGAEPASPGKPLAQGCAANSECASGFCVDGVCCNSACDGQCLNCAQSGSAGYCTSQPTGDDLNAAVPCNGAHTCSVTIPGLDLAACRLRDAQACGANSDCASLNCMTFYLDRDGDGFGGPSTLHLCEASGAAAPGGYSEVTGDCCDSDPNAFPGQTKYFTAQNACGSWDFSCDGTIEGSNGLRSLGTVPSTECAQTVHGSCISCTETVVCH